MKHIFIFLIIQLTILHANISREVELLQSLSLEELMEVKISTGTSKLLRDAPSTVSIITAEDIKRIGARTVAEALETIPGLHISPSTSQLPDNIYTFRGIKTTLGPQVLMLIDSERITFYNIGSRITGLKIPSSSVKRIEIIRGPGSALYGADAFSGVINIITKKGEDTEGVKVGSNFGSYNETQNWLQWAHIGDGYIAGLYFNILQSGNDKDRVVQSDLQTVFDSLFGTSASNAPYHLQTDYDIINFNADFKVGDLSMGLWGWINRDMGLGAGISNALDNNGYYDTTQIMARFKYDKSFTNFKTNTRLSLLYNNFKDYFTIFPAGAKLPINRNSNLDFSMSGNPPTLDNELYTFTDGLLGNPKNTERIINFETALLYEEIKKHKIRFLTGFNYINTRAKATQNFGPGILDLNQKIVSGQLFDTTDTPATYIPDAERAVIYAGIQDEYKINDRLELTLGLRYDHYNDVGSTLNPRVSLVWHTKDDLTTKLIYGRAFRAPSFSELYSKNNPVTLGSESLKPEVINSVELALEHRSSSIWHNSLNLYRYKVTDYARYVPESIDSSVLVARNNGHQRGYGLEYQTNLQVAENVSITANYAYVNTKDENGYVADVAAHQAYAQLNFDILPHLKFSNQLFYIGSKDRVQVDPRGKTPSFTLVNGTIRYIFDTIDTEASLSLYNMFDKKYVMPSPSGTIAGDYPMSGRSFSVQLQYRF